FFLFILVSLVILVGWVWLQNRLWPPKGPDKKDVAEKKDEDDKKDKEEKKPPAPVFAKWDRLPVPVKKVAAYAGTVAAPLHLAVPGFLGNPFIGESALVGSLSLVAQVKDLQTPKELPVKRHTLGGDGFFLEAELTTRGAGVQQVTFTEVTRFKAA